LFVVHLMVVFKHKIYKICLLYCSNSCTSLHFKILKSHTKTFKICPFMFRSPLKPSSGVHGCTLLSYWIGMLIYISYKECRYVAVCQFIPSACACVRACVCVCGYLSSLTQIGTHTHTHTHTQAEWIDIQSHTDTLYGKCKSTFQFSNLAKCGHGPPEDGFKEDQNM
jgi:hypothetical protein